MLVLQEDFHSVYNYSETKFDFLKSNKNNGVWVLRGKITQLKLFHNVKPFKSHSMARANLNKSKKALTSTPTVSKYIPKSLVKIPLNVNIVKHDLLDKKTVFENFMKWCLKGGFQLIQILGLLGM